MIPAGVAGAVLLLGGAAFAALRSGRMDTPSVQTVASRPATAQPQTLAQPVVRTDSAAGTIVSSAGDSVFAAIRDSIVRADEARRIRRAQAAAEAAARPQTYTDANGVVWQLERPEGFGTKQVITADSLERARAAQARAPKAREDSVAKAVADSTVLVAPPPMTPKIRIDSLVPKPKPDTTKPKPDTVKCCHN
jgi:hypothetical protein